MRRFTFCTAVLLLASVKALGQGQVVRSILMHDNVRRSYNLYVPSGYSTGDDMPLVVNLHGLGGNANQQMISSAMNAVAEVEGFLVAYPNAATSGDWGISDDHNISYIDTLLETVSAEYSVDSSRIYATGMSQGGIMSYLLAAARSSTFAAIASVGGTRPLAGSGPGLFPEFVPRVPSRPIPLMHVHGTSDVIVPYGGGNTAIPGLESVAFPAVETILNEWIDLNGCDTTPSVSSLPNIFALDGSTVTVLSYDGCEMYTSLSGAEIPADVVHYRVDGAGHSWPVLEADRQAAIASLTATFGGAALPVFMPINSDFAASEAIWSFFEQHHLAAIPEPGCISLAAIGGLLMLQIVRLRRS